MKNVNFTAIPEGEQNDTLYCFDCMIGYGRRQRAEYKTYDLNANRNIVLFCGKCANQNVIGLLWEGHVVTYERDDLVAPLSMVTRDTWIDRGQDKKRGGAAS